MFVVAERFLSDIVDKHGKYPISTDGGTWYPPQACRFLKLNHHIHSFVYKDEKSIIERTMQLSKIEQKDLTTTFHVERRIVN
jgi:putative transposase